MRSQVGVGRHRYYLRRPDALHARGADERERGVPYLPKLVGRHDMGSVHRVSARGAERHRDLPIFVAMAPGARNNSLL